LALKTQFPRAQRQVLLWGLSFWVVRFEVLRRLGASSSSPIRTCSATPAGTDKAKGAFVADQNHDANMRIKGRKR
jgi:hypothetical protein